MAGNPQIELGQLNRVRGSLVVTSNPGLNITAPFMGQGGITIATEGDATLLLPQMVGTVTSPAPYQMVTITVELLKTQSLSQAWETQRKLLSTIGDVVVTTDASTLAPYIFHNCAIENVGALPFNGTSATYGLTLKGYYDTNSSLFDLI